MLESNIHSTPMSCFCEPLCARHDLQPALKAHQLATCQLIDTARMLINVGNSTVMQRTILAAYFPPHLTTRCSHSRSSQHLAA
jgi:hypothetical protein